LMNGLATIGAATTKMGQHINELLDLFRPEISSH